MTDPDRSEEDDVGGSSKLRRPINWEAVAAIVAALIGLLAIVGSAYTAWETRQQTRAQVWPHVEVLTAGILPAFMVKKGSSLGDGGGVIVTNSGVGPAIVGRVEVRVNGKPVPDWPHLFKALGYSHGQPGATSALNGSVLVPGQQNYWVAIAGREDWLQFKQKVFNQVVIRVCYSSTLGDLWITTMKHSVPLNKRTQSVGSCARIPERNEFNG